MRFFIRIYICISLIASVGVSTGAFDLQSAVAHRSPFMLVELGYCTPDTVRDDGKSFGYDHKGKYVAYQPEDLGKDFISVFVWNPLNNSEDDILIRLDIEL